MKQEDLIKNYEALGYKKAEERKGDVVMEKKYKSHKIRVLVKNDGKSYVLKSVLNY